MAIPKTCNFCGKTFIAKTTVTKFCCLKCSSRNYKQRTRETKIQKSLKEPQQNMLGVDAFVTLLPSSVANKNFLSISDTAELIGVSRWTISRMIKRGDLQIQKFGRKKIIDRSQIDKMFT